MVKIGEKVNDGLKMGDQNVPNVNILEIIPTDAPRNPFTHDRRN